MPAALATAVVSATALAGPAAAASTAASVAAGARPYAASSPFNRALARPRTAPGSAAAIRTIFAAGVPVPSPLVLGVAGTDGDYGHPVYYSSADDPEVVLHAVRPYGTNPLEGRRIRVPADARPAGGGDAHMAIVAPDGTEVDLWDVRGGGPVGGTLTFGWGGETRIDGSGVGGASTAAGFAALAGVLRPAELARGRVDHALFLSVRCVRGRVAPATGTGGTPCPAGVAGPPMGARLQLRMTRREIGRLRVPPWKRAVLRALARYGGYVGDTGGAALGVGVESGAPAAAAGREEPFVAFARGAGIRPYAAGRYGLDLAGGVPWRSRLRVVR